MALAKITQVTGTAVHVPGSDIDTDRIIPARFMKCVTFDGLGEFAFHDVRFDKDGKPAGHPLDDPRFKGASILVSGSNFGCGSSREHAPQALYRFGFRAVIAQSFAEIFFGNCTTLGIPCVCATAEDIARLAAAVEADPRMEVVVDVASRQVRFGAESIPVTVPATAHDALTSGRWDPIGELLEARDAIHSRMTALGWV
ncbi:MAG TPA: 3-isopropylmalate dehydratase small subunit [Prosthecobacter sp.]|nr:3-isopropylmalate dehydratase small subunit [Prosthecobacter sp.]HRK14678.1 3-isopropylmalate dehydratase small subunit [Prosthecobacter sp.]